MNPVVMRSVTNRFAIPVLIAALGLMLTGPVTAQTFTTLHNFDNEEGANPYGALTLSGNTLYGTTTYGGSARLGILFAIHTDGTSFTNLHTFTGRADGAYPSGRLLLSGNTLFGTTYNGGSALNGTIFSIHSDGTGFTNLHSFTTLSGPYPFTNSDGATPYAGLILSGNTLYGTAAQGGRAGVGTVFSLLTDGTAFTNLHSFAGHTNDGDWPYGSLILSGDTLYGTTQYGGVADNGVVFAVGTNGTGYTNLHIFSATAGDLYTNSDGAIPYAGLLLLGYTLYGTTQYGGSSGYGTVFKVNTDGTGFTNLHVFIGYPTDGEGPCSGLLRSGESLYGTATSGGTSADGTVFVINTNGRSFTNLYNFSAASGTFYTNIDGDTPYAELVLTNNTLYGTAFSGGASGYGTVFSLSFRPELTITASGTNMILTWPTNYAGFDYTEYGLQSTTNLLTPVWTTNSPAPFVVNGQNTVTNPISGTRKFYRLSQ